MINQNILPVISDWKTFEQFLKNSQTWCILMDFHINFMEELLQRLHDSKKRGIVHMDLVKGLSNDSFGVQYMCQKCHADGIISTKPKAIEQAKKQHCISILRIFMIDSRSVEKGGKLAEETKPDYIEVLPAIIPEALALIREYSDIPVIGGGLIRNRQDITRCLQQGMVSVTTSNMKFCKEESE